MRAFSSDTPASHTSRPQSQRSLLAGMFFLVLLTAVYIFFNQYDYLLGPQKLFVIKILRLQFPWIFLQSPLIDLQDKAYYTFLAWPLAALNHWVSLQWLFFIGHFLTTFFYLAGVYLIAKKLFEDHRVAWLCVLGVMVIKPVLIDASLYPTYFYHRNVAMFLQFFAIWFFLKRHLSWTAFFLGVSFLITPYSAVHLGFLFLWGILPVWKTYRVKEILQAFLILFVTALPMVIWRFFESGGGSGDFSGAEWIKAVQATGPGYIYPSHLWKEETGSLTTFLMALVWPFLFWLGYRKARLEKSHQQVLAMMAGVLLLFVLAVLTAEIWPCVELMQLMPMRAHRFFVLFSIVYFMFYLFRRFKEEDSIQGRIFLVFMTAAFLSSKMILTVFMAAMDLALQQRFFGKRQSKSIVFALISLCFILISLSSLLGTIPLLDRLFHLYPFFLILVLLTGCYLEIMIRYSNSPVRSAGQTFLFGLFFFSLLLPHYWHMEGLFFREPFKVIQRQIDWPWDRGVTLETDKLMQWVRLKTPRDAVFLMPPFDSELGNHFSVKTQRNDVLSGESVGSILSLDFFREWKARMLALTGNERGTHLEDKYRQLNDSSIQILQKEYPFNYFIGYRTVHRLSYPMVFENSRHIIYKMTPQEGPDDRV